jgi:hypothetical protein
MAGMVPWNIIGVAMEILVKEKVGITNVTSRDILLQKSSQTRYFKARTCSWIVLGKSGLI